MILIYLHILTGCFLYTTNTHDAIILFYNLIKYIFKKIISRKINKNNFQIKLITPLGKFIISDTISDYIFLIHHIKNISEISYMEKIRGNIIDIGAHQGIFSIPIAIRYKELGLKYKIFAFEPSLRNFKLLNDNIRLNNLEEILIPFNLGISDHEGEADFIENYNASAKNSIVTSSCKTSKLTFVKIKLSSIDDILQLKYLKNVQTIALMKIDVEGHELSVIRGAKNALNRINIEEIYCEIWDNKENKDEVIKSLKNHGYILSNQINDNFIFRKYNA